MRTGPTSSDTRRTPEDVSTLRTACTGCTTTKASRTRAIVKLTDTFATATLQWQPSKIWRMEACQWSGPSRQTNLEPLTRSAPVHLMYVVCISSLSHLALLSLFVPLRVACYISVYHASLLSMSLLSIHTSSHDRGLARVARERLKLIGGPQVNRTLCRQRAHQGPN